MAAPLRSSLHFDPRPRQPAWRMAAKFGRVRERIHGGKPRYYLDFGRTGKVYSLHGDPFADRAEAEMVLRAVQGRVAEGTPKRQAVEVYLPTHSRAHRVEVWLERWIEEMESLLASGDRSEGTLREYRRWSKVGEHGYLARLGKRSIHSLTYTVLREWQREIPVSGKTAKNVTAALSSFLGWLVRVQAIERKPTIPWPQHDEHVPNVIRPERQDEILAHWPADELGVVLAMMLLGLRHGEAFALRGTDYRDGYLWVRHARKGRRLDSPVRGPKNRQPRVLPVPDALREWIEVHVPAKRLLTEEPLFTNPRTAGAWSPSSFRRRWEKACTAAGYEKAPNSYESLRHSTATEWLRRGASLREVQDLLGHRTGHMTPRYARLANERLVEIVGRRGE